MQELDGRKYFWRLNNEDENHNGYQYKDGLNELPTDEKFNPSGSCEPGGLYFLGDAVLQWAYYQKYSWLRMVEIPDDARVYEDPHGDKCKADKLFLHPRMPFLPDGVMKILREDSRSLTYLRENTECRSIEVLLLKLAKHGADPRELQPIFERFPEIHLDVQLALYIYVGDLKKVRYLIKIAPDRLVEDICRIAWVPDAIFTFPKSLQFTIIKLLVARESLPALLNLYYSAPEETAPYLERQLWKLVKRYSSPPYDRMRRYDGSIEALFELAHIVRPLSFPERSARLLSKRILTAINNGTKGRLEYLFIVWLLCSATETEEQFYLAAYNILGKKKLSPEQVMIEALGNKAHIRQPDISVLQMLHVMELLGLKPTTPLVYGQNIRIRYKGVIPTWNKLVKQNVKQNTKQKSRSKKRQPTAAAR